MIRHPLLSCFMACCVCIFVLSRVAFAERIRNVPAEYPTIQAAINASDPGDTVQVAEGTYSGTGNTNLTTLGRQLTVRGTGNAAGCIISAAGTSQRAFVISSGETNATIIDGLTITRPTLGGGGQDTGGGVLVDNQSSPLFRNCIFQGCFVDRPFPNTFGGAVAIKTNSHPRFEGCRFLGNYNIGGQAPTARHIWGGAVYAGSGCRPEFFDCLFVNNQCPGGGGADSPSMGFGAAIAGEDILMVRCTFRDSRLDAWGTAQGGAVYGRVLTLVDCIFQNNVANGRGPAHAPPTAQGGAIYAQSGATIINCLFSGNGASGFAVDSPPSSAFSGIASGGGIHVNAGEVTIVNCTITGNQAVAFRKTGDTTTLGHGGGVFAASANLRNTVLWNNTNSVQSQQLDGTGTLTLGHCDIEGGLSGGWVDAGGNISTDPMFVDAGAADYRLSDASPAIDAGDNAALPADTQDVDGDSNTTEEYPIDLRNAPRRIDMPAVADTGNGAPPVVDMGAYETFPFGNYDDTGDESVTVADWPAFAECMMGPNNAPAPSPPPSVADCLYAFDGNFDGDVDLQDFAGFQAAAE